MGDVVRFRTGTPMRPATPATHGTVLAKEFAATPELKRVLIRISGFEAIVLVSPERQHYYRNLLRWTRAFCAQLGNATELHNLKELAGAREQLKTDLIEIERHWSKP